MVIRLGDAIFWIAVACCVVAQVAIVRSSLVSPAQAPAPGSTSAAGISTARRALEVFWAAVPGIALALLFAATWRATHAATASVVLNSLLGR